MEHAIEPHVYYSLNIGGSEVPFITDAVVNTWVIIAAIMVLTLLLTRNLKTVPAGVQKAVETAVEQINNLAKGQIGHHYKAFVPYLGTVLIFLVFSNLISLFNVIPSGEALAALFGNPSLSRFTLSLHPPTKNINVTLCMAVISMVVVVGAEFRYRGILGWARGFIKPTPISGLLKLLDYVVRPLSLCLRLFGNILGAVIVMTLIYSVAPIAAPAVAGIYFDIFDGALQAYVFVFLTSIYISESVEEIEE